MKILFVAANPKLPINVEYPMVHTKSFKTLLKWLPKLGITDKDKVWIINASNKLADSTSELRVGDMNLENLQTCISNTDKVIALGDYAADAISRVWDGEFGMLPHPSGLNRKLNSSTFLTFSLNQCKIYLND